jgi:GT2 family glycosyltransferase
VDIILVNWNGVGDVLECLESVFRLRYPCFRVIVCDNASNDGSLGKIEKWARGDVRVSPASGSFDSLFSGPRLKEPFPYKRYLRSTAETVTAGQHDPSLILIDTGGNLGFAGGNNVGLRYSLAHGNSEYVWLLNTDTVIDADALTHLVDRAMISNTIGAVGSKLIHYWEPTVIQATGGGSFDIKSTSTHHLGAGTLVSDDSRSENAIEADTDYIIGASMLVTKPFLEQVGLMCEDYFLYFEELDWSTRAGSKFKLGYSPKSLVYHKVGGSSSKVASVGALRYLYRSRLIFVARHFPTRYIPTLITLSYEMIRHALKGRIKHAVLIWETLLSAKLLQKQGRDRAGHFWQ